MRNTRKIFIAVLVVMTLLVSLAAATIPASAATTTRTIYLDLTGSNWPDASAWMEAWVWGSSQTSDAWYKFTDADGDGYYEAQIPSDATGMKIIRRGPNQTQGSWDGGQQWDSTGDVKISSSTNCYKLTGWNTSGSWSSYTPACTDHNYDEYGLCTNDGCSAGCYYTVTGNSADIFGSAWAPATGNKMHYDSATSTYIYVAEGVATGEYKFKCVKNGSSSWSGAIGGTGSNADADGNFVFNVETDNSTVTITLKGGVISVSIDVPHVHSWSDATCTEPQKCSCGETQGEALGHTPGDAATCTTAQTCTACGAELAAALGHKDENNDYICDVCKISICTTHEYTYACDKVCLKCNGITRPEAEHTIVHVEAVAATCTADGNVEYWYCSDCGYAWTDEALTKITNLLSVVTPAGHSIVVDEAVEATCTTEGKTAGQHCENCDDETVAQEIVPELGHDAEDGSCSRCDYRFVYVVNSNEWTKINAYAWNGSGNNSWPGVAMTKTDDTVNGFEIYYIEFTAAYESIIFNDGKAQTADLALAPGKYFDLSNAAWYDSLDDVPAPDPLKTDDTIAGSFNGWNSGSHVFRLEEEGGSVSYIYLELEANKTYEFKILKNGTWHGNSGTITDSITGWDFKTTIEANCTITTTVAGTYVFALDGTKLSITYPHVCSYEAVVTAPTCTEAGYTTYTCSCGDSYTADETEATGHTWENCECANCDAVLTKVELTDSFDFTTADGLAAALASGKIGYTGTFRDNGDSHQFAADSSIQLIVPAYTTVTITGHSTGYGVFDVYVNGVKQDMAGQLKFFVTEDTKVVILPDEEATYSKAYLKGISFEEYIDRTIHDDTTITFGSDGNYKESIVDFSGIQIGDNGGSNSQVKNGSFDLLLKAGAVVKIHGYSGYTSYQLNGGKEITEEYHTYIALEDTTLKVTPVNGNNYFYSIEIVYHDGIALVPAKDATCTEAGNVAYYSCTCHAEPLTDKGETAAPGHTEVVDAAVAPTCTAAGKTEGSHCSVCNEVLVAQEPVAALGHSYSAAVTAPTCTEAGYTTYTCSVCTNSYIADEVTAKGHTEVVDAAVAPTCTATGLTAGKHCSVCNEVLVAQTEVAALGHTEVVDAAVAPTCTATGLTEGKHCSVCNEVLVAQTEVAALGHTEQTVAGKAATCTETGLTEGKKCSVCGTVILAQSEIPALGHTDNNKDYTCDVCETDLCTDHTVVTIPGKAATCTETGLTEGEKCSNCGDVLVAQTVIDALGHSYGAVVTDPTCTEAGYTTYTCSACSHSYVADEVAATGHSYDNGVVTVDPTCTEEGTKTFTCSCEHSYTESIPVIAHDYSAAVTAPTCTEAGYTTYTCSACSHSYVADEVASLGHSYGAAVTAPTCTEAGYTTYTCSACSHSYVADEVAALTHDMIVDAAVAATCTESGLTEGSHCTRCDHKVEQEVVPALGHTDEDKNYVCDACEAVLCTEHTEEVVPGKAATCTESGLTEGKKCSVCGEIIVAQTVVDALGHTEVVDAAIAATCTEAGKTEGKHCSACNEVLVAQTEVAALGHDMQAHTETLPTCEADGVEAGEECSRCGHKVGLGVIDALGHDFNEGACTRCGEKDPGYVAPEQPDDETPEQPEPELNFFQKIVKAIADFFKSIGNWFKNLFTKK